MSTLLTPALARLSAGTASCGVRGRLSHRVGERPLGLAAGKAAS
jgi:hypothetical protein